MAASGEAVMAAAKQLVSFINKSPSPFHAVDECRKRLLTAGFKELKECEHWTIKPSDKYFVTRNQSTLIAFAVGGAYKAGNGFSIVGAHTDSPCLKVKPVSRKTKHNYIQVAVECYGGGTWPTWFDRDLKVAGRVLVRNGEKIDHRLVHIERPILRVPNIAIHLNRKMGTELEINKETNIIPVLATSTQMMLTGGGDIPEPDEPKCQSDKHHPILVDILAKELSVKPTDIMDFELCLADCQDGAIGGALSEFIFAPRLDNLLSSFCAMEGLINSCQGERLTNEPNIRLINLYDNEEVGSSSAQGAGSSFTEYVLRRLETSMEGFTPVSYEEAIPKSLLISCDVAHATHPNYADKHEDRHRPHFHKGPVIKFNTNQRYATTAITASILRLVAEKAQVPLQDFVVRNDVACGSTIGPILSSKMGIPTVDIGAPLLSMHSIREMGDVNSVLQSIKLFQSFFETYAEVMSNMNI